MISNFIYLPLLFLSLMLVFTPQFTSGTAECSRTNPCSDGSCCSKWGHCGYGNKYCGNGCLSNCDNTEEPPETECSKTRPCADGSCCSKWGYCGHGKQFCGRGCLSNCESGPDGGSEIEQGTTIKLGANHRKTTSPSNLLKTTGRTSGAQCSKTRPCENGVCCSKWGFCGLGEQFCGQGCQSNCDNKNKPSSECSKTVLCPDDACCSKWGFCGFGTEHCGQGCLSNCHDQDKKLAKNNTTPIIEKRRVNKEQTVIETHCSRNRPCPDGSCCSKWGYCGTTAEFCGSGCQSNCNAFAQEDELVAEEEDEEHQQPPREERQCSAKKPCPDGSCCSKYGFCGYGAEYCTNGCLSNCDSKATGPTTTECGRHAPPGHEHCPLNICCSQFGYCGTTAEFCRSGCQSNCQKPSRPLCPNAKFSPLGRVIGYYASWSLDPSVRKCGIIPPEKINPDAYTHIIASFATIEDCKLKITNSEKDVLQRFVQLKRRNPKLKVMLAVGGWAFNDRPTHKVFTQTASTLRNRVAFSKSVVDLLDSLEIDGLDVDWEYPVAEERGGEPEDLGNYVLLLKELRRRFGTRLLLSIAAPASYWYLRHFDLMKIGEVVDWINVMSYDMHGVWDSPRVPYAYSHVNLTEIDSALEIYYRAGIRPEQLNLGLAFYARTFHLSSPSCTLPGCEFDGPAEAGECTENPGTLSYHEIVELLANNPNLEPRLDKLSASKLVVWGDNQWVGYDDPQTIRLKIDYVRTQCLGGVMVWSIDQDDKALSLQNTLYLLARKPITVVRQATVQPRVSPIRRGVPVPAGKKINYFFRPFISFY